MAIVPCSPLLLIAHTPAFLRNPPVVIDAYCRFSILPAYKGPCPYLAAVVATYQCDTRWLWPAQPHTPLAVRREYCHVRTRRLQQHVRRHIRHSHATLA